jgi:plasmid stabilization system protein ParE
VIELRIAEAAALSIVEQADYYEQTANPALAQIWGAAVEQAIQSLLSLPERGTPCHFRSSSLAGIRWIPIAGFPKHMVFYRYLSQEPAILIVQVLHGARNLETILDEDA